MSFQRAGSAPCRDDEARAELATLASDGIVHSIRVAPDDRVTEWSPSLVDLLGQPALSLTGGVVHDLQGLSTSAFGTMLDHTVLHQDADRIDAVVTYRHAVFRLTTLALRNDEGWADEAEILIAAERVDRPAS